MNRGTACTTGFAIRQAGLNGLLTAAHRAADNQTANDGAGQLVGTYASDVNANDVGVIRGPSQPRAWNNTTNAVAGGQASAVGNFVCTSGSFSGTRCRIQVAAVNQRVNLSTPAEGVVLVCGQVRPTRSTAPTPRARGTAAGR